MALDEVMTSTIVTQDGHYVSSRIDSSLPMFSAIHLRLVVRDYDKLRQAALIYARMKYRQRQVQVAMKPPGKEANFRSLSASG